ncbi:MAG: CHAT domain-containing protein [Anaerolineaceae bacterium]|nr:CHAT domain-containing protein [Anaerolineaceae bacterium]
MPLHTLTVKQTKKGEKDFHVALTYDSPGYSDSAEVEFAFELSAEDQSNIRWYLEDYLEKPYIEPNPTLAANVAARIEAIGAELFQKVFEGNTRAVRMWGRMAPDLKDTRVEVSTGVAEATAIPWELLRDPDTGNYLAVNADTFVRTPTTAALPMQYSPSGDKVRILLVICRPGKDKDVPFRSVASRILKGLPADAREYFQLDVLRPPTFAQLTKTLDAAKAAGTPYHIVHFDGHGGYFDAKGLADFVPSLEAHKFRSREGKHGYLAFENAAMPDNTEYINGQELGAALYNANVPALVLNACQSAYAEVPDSEDDKPKPTSDDSTARQGEVSAFGSLAQEVINQGVPGVVAMRYSVYVVTAAQFVAELYAGLAGGKSLGDAVSDGRKNLYHQPARSIAFRPVDLQDWQVPVVFEAMPIHLFPGREAPAPGNIQITLTGDGGGEQGPLDSALPREPDSGFFGRDETLLALDRAFDTKTVVLLHAYAGSGKTVTAAEFARWYSLTGGLPGGAVVFSTFEQYRPLLGVLSDFGRVFAPSLEQLGIPWNALDMQDRRSVALQVMAQLPVLWIWDNVEPVAGFPEGQASTWSAAEQRELADFLRDARGTKGKFLLTSRREERAWLGELPYRIAVPPMPLRERVQLAGAVAEHAGSKLADVTDWVPLLKYSAGNPLTITVLVRQVVRQGMTTGDAIGAFVEKLRAGEVAIEDDETQKRDKSLAASLQYGFDDAFGDAERHQLAVLHLFQGWVDVDTLGVMGVEEADWCLDSLRGLTRETGITLLDKATAIGLLRQEGDGFYTIHPALPWVLGREFNRFYPTEAEKQAARRAYAGAVGYWGNEYHDMFGAGQRGVIDLLAAEEANLLYARRLTRANNWWDNIGTMQGLFQLYTFTGRGAEWRGLVAEIVPDFCAPTTDLPLPGRDATQWGIVMQYRVRLAQAERDWEAALRLQTVRTEGVRQQDAPYLDQPDTALDNTGRHWLRTLGVSLEELGHIQREVGQADCVKNYEEAITLYQRIGDQAAEAVAAFNLGHAYLTIPAIRDLDQAEEWYQKSLKLRPEGDPVGQGKSLNELGRVQYERFNAARKAGQMEDAARFLVKAAEYYEQALGLFPAGAVNDLAVSHNALGAIYTDAGQIEGGLAHWDQAIRYMEQTGNLHHAGTTRRNVALALWRQGRLRDALLYAGAALRNFEAYQGRAAADEEQTRRLIAAIEEAMGG